MLLRGWGALTAGAWFSVELRDWTPSARAFPPKIIASFAVPRMYSNAAEEYHVDSYDVPDAAGHRAAGCNFLTPRPRRMRSASFLPIPPSRVGDLHPTPNRRLVICRCGMAGSSVVGGGVCRPSAGLLDVNATAKGYMTAIIF